MENVNEKKKKKKKKLTPEERLAEKNKLRANRKLIRESSKGAVHHFLIGIIAIAAANLSAYCIPLITSFTIDYVLLDYAEAGYEGSMVVAPWVERIVDSIGGKPFLVSHLYLLAIALVLMTAINAVSVFLRRSEVAKGSEKMAYNMRTRLYEHLQNVPYDYHKHISSGDIIQRCTTDVDTIRRFVQNQLLEIVRTLLMIVIAATIMFRMQSTLALYSIVMMPFLAIASYIYCMGVKKHFTLTDEAEGTLSAAIQENASGMRVVRAFGQRKEP